MRKIKTYEVFNESLKDKMKGPSDDSVDKGIEKIIEELTNYVSRVGWVDDIDISMDKLYDILEEEYRQMIIDMVTIHGLNVEQMIELVEENWEENWEGNLIMLKKKSKEDKVFNESLKDKLKGKTEEELIESLKSLSDSDKIKTIINNQLPYDLLPDNLIINGDLFCYNIGLTNLPDNLTINGYLDCGSNQLTNLPDNLVVHGDLGCSSNLLTTLPDDLIVDENIDCSYNSLISLPDNLVVHGDLRCDYNKLINLPKGLIVHGYLDCSNNDITYLHGDIIVDEYLDCSYNNLKEDIKIKPKGIKGHLII